MRIYWYWPHPHRAASPLALATLRPGDELVVHALPSLNTERFGAISEYEVVRDLPDPSVPASTLTAKVLRKPQLTLRRSRRRWALASKGFDVSHIETLSYQTDWIDLRLLSRRTALVSVVHDIRPHGAPQLGSMSRGLLRSTYSSAGHLVVYHERLRDELIEDFEVDPSRVHVLPLPLDSGLDVQHRAAEPKSGRTVLMFGSLRRNKGAQLVLDLLERGLPTLASTRFVIAGAGDPEIEDEVRRRSRFIENLDVEIGIVSADRKAALFSEADIVMLPYTSFHSQSGVLGDAYAYRRPLLVTDVGALGDTVRSDGTGIVVTPGSVEDLLDGLLRLLSEHPGAKREHLDRAARRHDYATVGPMLREVYDAAFAERGAA